MTTNTLGLINRIPLHVIATALEQWLFNEHLDIEYIKQQLQLEITGDLRLTKATKQVQAYFVNNSILDFLSNHRDELFRVQKNTKEFQIVALALMVSKYSFAYDVVTTLGKLFHIEDVVITSSIINKLGIKYGHNKNMDNTFYMISPAIHEAGLFHRPKAGVYEIVPKIELSPFTLQVWSEAFYAHNPLFSRENSEMLRFEPFFEFFVLP